jgi:hypothetical protein
VKIKGSGGTR